MVAKLRSFLASPTLFAALSLAACQASFGPGAAGNQMATQPFERESPRAGSCSTSSCIYGTCSFETSLRNKVNLYDEDQTGNKPPIDQIAGPGTMLRGPQGIAVDQTHRVYVAN